MATRSSSRIFSYNGKVLEDPVPNEPVKKAMEILSVMHPELNNAVLKGPTVGRDGVKHYKIENGWELSTDEKNTHLAEAAQTICYRSERV